MALTLRNIENCYNTLKEIRSGDKVYHKYDIGRYVGYLEAGLVSFDSFETELVDGVICAKRELIKGNSWWVSDRLETIEESIIRQVEKLLKK